MIRTITCPIQWRIQDLTLGWRGLCQRGGESIRSLKNHRSAAVRGGAGCAPLDPLVPNWPKWHQKNIDNNHMSQWYRSPLYQLFKRLFGRKRHPCTRSILVFCFVWSGTFHHLGSSCEVVFQTKHFLYNLLYNHRCTKYVINHSHLFIKRFFRSVQAASNIDFIPSVFI